MSAERDRILATVRSIERNARAFDRAGHHHAAERARAISESARERLREDNLEATRKLAKRIAETPA